MPVSDGKEQTSIGRNENWDSMRCEKIFGFKNSFYCKQFHLLFTFQRNLPYRHHKKVPFAIFTAEVKCVRLSLLFDDVVEIEDFFRTSYSELSFFISKIKSAVILGAWTFLCWFTWFTFGRTFLNSFEIICITTTTAIIELFTFAGFYVEEIVLK